MKMKMMRKSNCIRGDKIFPIKEYHPTFSYERVITWKNPEKMNIGIKIANPWMKIIKFWLWNMSSAISLEEKNNKAPAKKLVIKVIFEEDKRIVLIFSGSFFPR